MNRTEYDEIRANLIKKSLERSKTDVYVPVERRKKEDGILNFINLVCFLGWGALFIVVSIIVKAGRSVAYINNNELLWLPSNFWRVDLLRVAMYVTIGCICVCTISIVLNFARHKRRTDRIKKSLIFCEIIGFLIGVFLILKLY